MPIENPLGFSLILRCCDATMWNPRLCQL